MSEKTEIKLIACDLDGTLCPPNQTAVPEENLRAIELAEQAGILFCPATGRSLYSAAGLNERLPYEHYSITSNGGVVYAPRAVPVAARPFERELALELCHRILSVPGSNLMMDGGDTIFVLKGAEDFADFLQKIMHEKVTLVDSVEAVTAPLVKITAHFLEPEKMYRILSSGCGGRFHVAISGPIWVDQTMADKGTGVEDLCRYLQLPPENVMAIGDNYNDVPMLDRVGCPVLMKSAAAPLRERYGRTCASVAEAIYSLLE